MKISEAYITYYKYKGRFKYLKLIANLGYVLTVLYSLSTFFWKKGGLYKVISKFIWYLIYFTFKCDLSLKAKNNGIIIFPHPIGIVIGEGVEIIGVNIIYQNVTLGQNKNLYPVVISSTIYTSSVVCGNLTLKDEIVPALTRKII